MDSVAPLLSPVKKRQLSGDDWAPARYTRSRQDSISGELGKEGKPLPVPKAHSGKSIGIFTSGGDSQGKLYYFDYIYSTASTT